MSIGSIIRTEAISREVEEAYARTQRRPMIMPRQYARRLRSGEDVGGMKAP